ncbi:MAG: hypothetical protein H7222_12820 [Methylotenera sp.]|nr:hypothetical protein [Oligoflexia bacterium]
MAARREIRHDQRGPQKDERPHRAQLMWTCTVALAVAATAFFQLGSPRNALLTDSTAEARTSLGEMPGVAQRFSNPSDFAVQLAPGLVPEAEAALPLERVPRKARQPSSR